MKYVFIIALAAVVLAAFSYKPPEETNLYLGHAQYQFGRKSTCVVWAIHAANLKQADSLFMVVVDSCVNANKAVLIKGNYKVWKIEEAAVLKINQEHDIKLKPF